MPFPMWTTGLSFILNSHGISFLQSKLIIILASVLLSWKAECFCSPLPRQSQWYLIDSTHLFQFKIIFEWLKICTKFKKITTLKLHLCMSIALCKTYDYSLEVILQEFGENRNITASLKVILLRFTTKHSERQCPWWAFFIGKDLNS